MLRRSLNRESSCVNAADVVIIEQVQEIGYRRICEIQLDLPSFVLTDISSVC